VLIPSARIVARIILFMLILINSSRNIYMRYLYQMSQWWPTVPSKINGTLSPLRPAELFDLAWWFAVEPPAPSIQGSSVI
jgi:hypothetical protein